MFSILCLSGKRGLKQLQWQKLYTLQRWITNLMQGQNPLVHHHLQLRPRSHQFQLLSTHLQQVTHPGSRQHSRLNVLLLQKLDQQDCQVPQLLHRPQIQLTMPGVYKGEFKPQPVLCLIFWVRCSVIGATENLFGNLWLVLAKKPGIPNQIFY